MDTRDAADRRSQDTGTVPRSIERVLDLFEIVVGAGPANLTSIAADADLTPTTTLRYLRALDLRGYVQRDDDGRYSAGPTAIRLAAVVRDASEIDRLVVAARPVLESLAAETGESAYLSVSDGISASYVATAESQRAIRHVGWVGQKVPLAGTAVGAAMAKPSTLAIRTGAVEPDITAVSMALPATSAVDSAISLIGPAHRFDDRACRAAGASLARAVDTLVRRLGVDNVQVAS